MNTKSGRLNAQGINTDGTKINTATATFLLDFGPNLRSYEQSEPEAVTVILIGRQRRQSVRQRRTVLTALKQLRLRRFWQVGELDQPPGDENVDQILKDSNQPDIGLAQQMGWRRFGHADARLVALGS